MILGVYESCERDWLKVPRMGSKSFVLRCAGQACETRSCQDPCIIPSLDFRFDTRCPQDPGLSWRRRALNGDDRITSVGHLEVKKWLEDGRCPPIEAILSRTV